MKGKIIVIEGTDCSGKETQSLLLKKRLNSIEKKWIRFGFPMYNSPTGKIVGGCYLGKPEIADSFFPEGAVNVDPHIACLYYAADRKYNMAKINQYLEDGYCIILDRYTTSNLAHQGSKIKDKAERFKMYKWIDDLEFGLLGLPKPDKTIFLHMPYEQSLTLKANRELLDEHEKSEEHLKLAEKSYLELAELYHWTTIECVHQSNIKTIKDINDEIFELIKRM